MARRLISFPGIETAYADLAAIGSQVEFTVSIGDQDYNVTPRQIFAMLGLDPDNLIEGGGGSVTATALAPNTDFGFFTVDENGVAYVDDTAIRLVKLENIAENVFLGRDSPNDGPIEELTPAAARALLELSSQGSTYATALQALLAADKRAHILAMGGLALGTGETWTEDALAGMTATTGAVKPVTPIPDVIATGGEILDGRGADISIAAESYGEALQPKTGNLDEDDALIIDLSSGGGRGLNYAETISANFEFSITDIDTDWLGSHVLRVQLTNSDTTAWTITYTDTDEVAFVPATGVTPPSTMPTEAGATLVFIFDLQPGSPKKRAALINHYVIPAS